VWLLHCITQLLGCRGTGEGKDTSSKQGQDKATLEMWEEGEVPKGCQQCGWAGDRFAPSVPQPG